MKFVNINNLHIGKKEKNKFCLGVFDKNKQLYEILTDGKTIDIGTEVVEPMVFGDVQAIMFKDFDDEWPRQSLFELSDLNISENLLSKWAAVIRSDRLINRTLCNLADPETSAGYRDAAENALKEELMFLLLEDYNRALQAECELDSLPEAEK